MREDEATEQKGRRRYGAIAGRLGSDQFYYDRGRGFVNCINVLFWGKVWRFLCMLNENLFLFGQIRFCIFISKQIVNMANPYLQFVP
jgi:hypothetical protein